MARLTASQWLEARQKWEADPSLTFESLADKLGLSRQLAVSKQGLADLVDACRTMLQNRL